MPDPLLNSDSWINWRSVATTTVTRIIMFTPGGLLILAVWLYGIAQQWADTAAALGTHLLEVAESSERDLQQRAEDRSLMEQILDMQKDSLLRDRTIVGLGKAGTFGDGESYVRVNRRSDAKVYREGESVVITIIGDGDNRQTLPIKGTFADTDRDVMLVFSRGACRELGITGPVEVMMEPPVK